MLKLVVLFLGLTVGCALAQQLVSFKDNFAQQPNTSFYYYQGPWANGPPGMNGWVGQLVSVGPDGLILTCSNVGCPEACSYQPYACGSLQTLGSAINGYYEASFKCPNVTGIDCSFFLYGQVGAPTYARTSEIDIEILGNDFTTAQFNWWVNNTQHPFKVPLGFDSSADFHVYGIEITDTYIEFSADGKVLYTYKEDFTTYLKPMQMFMNFWPCHADGWCSPPEFTYTGPSHMLYHYISYTAPNETRWT